MLETGDDHASQSAQEPQSVSAPQLPPTTPKGSLYFGYGSNLWLAQMEKRCPSSIYLGVALLRGWRWIINTRGYANIIPSPDDLVYGLVYEINAKDEANLDINEGVPYAYVKRHMQVVCSGEGSALGNDGEVLTALVYVDMKRIKEDSPNEEYVYRMNMGIADAVKMGVPEEYVEKYMRPFIPDEKGK